MAEFRSQLRQKVLRECKSFVVGLVVATFPYELVSETCCLFSFGCAVYGFRASLPELKAAAGLEQTSVGQFFFLCKCDAEVLGPLFPHILTR